MPQNIFMFHSPNSAQTGSNPILLDFVLTENNEYISVVITNDQATTEFITPRIPQNEILKENIIGYQPVYDPNFVPVFDENNVQINQPEILGYETTTEMINDVETFLNQNVSKDLFEALKYYFDNLIDNPLVMGSNIGIFDTKYNTNYQKINTTKDALSMLFYPELVNTPQGNTIEEIILPKVLYDD